jgi:hypothetical protein
MNDAQRKIVDDLLLECAHYDQADRCDALLALLAQSTPPPREPYREAYLRGYEAGKRDAAPDSATREPEGT